MQTLMSRSLEIFFQDSWSTNRKFAGSRKNMYRYENSGFFGGMSCEQKHSKITKQAIRQKEQFTNKIGYSKTKVNKKKFRLETRKMIEFYSIN